MRVFISQPMQGKTEQEILKVQERAAEDVKRRLGISSIDVINNCRSPFDSNAPINLPLLRLSEILSLLATADIAYFVSGWENARGCRIEHICAEEYHIGIMEEEEKEPC